MNNDDNVTTCGQEGCIGHLTKFANCLTEAIYMQREENDDFIGDQEFGSTLTLMHYSEPSVQPLDDVIGPQVTIPAGWYSLSESTTGVVHLFEYGGDEQAARQGFDETAEAYSDWLGEEDT